MKPLASWCRDLSARLDQFEKWATSAHPPMVFWLSGFTFPTGFLTAVLQKSARLNNVRTMEDCHILFMGDTIECNGEFEAVRYTTMNLTPRNHFFNI